MNKAFLREPEEGDPPCPGCGSMGMAVGGPTLEARAGADGRAKLGDTAWYCPGAACALTYYNAWGASVAAARPAWPKNPEAPVCACFGVTAAQIEQEARAGRKERLREWIARASGPEARCLTAAADGRSCAGELRRVFLSVTG